MKLLYCYKCGDIFNLTFKEKSCGCGETKGQYIDELNAQISGQCQPLGIANESFKSAHTVQKIRDNPQNPGKEFCQGVEFVAFFIPAVATSIKRVEK